MVDPDSLPCMHEAGACKAHLMTSSTAEVVCACCTIHPGMLISWTMSAGNCEAN